MNNKLKNKNLKFVLSFTSGILILLGGFFTLLALLFLLWVSFNKEVVILISLLALFQMILGIIIINNAKKIKTQRDQKASSVILICNILSLLLLFGFIIGPILGIIAYFIKENG